MFEKVNPSHPDKIADRIAGAIVDLAYTKEENPKIAVEVLIGHRFCHIIAETCVHIPRAEVEAIVYRIGGNLVVDYQEVEQNIHLAANQSEGMRCGDNGIFRGVPKTWEQNNLSEVARHLYERFPTDGKFVFADYDMIICQSYATDEEIKEYLGYCPYPMKINPLGFWTGGTDVDTGATNRKLGSDMGDSVTGGGLHGKDLSKADVSVNIYAFLKAQDINKPVELYCAIGDREIDGKPYSDIVDIARDYIKSVGGFEKFAEWGLI